MKLPWSARKRAVALLLVLTGVAQPLGGRLPASATTGRASEPVAQTDARLLAAAKSLCTLPDDEHSVDRALDRLRALGVAPTEEDLWNAARGDGSGLAPGRDVAALAPPRPALDEGYRLDVAGDAQPGRGLGEGPLALETVEPALDTLSIVPTGAVLGIGSRALFAATQPSSPLASGASGASGVTVADAAFPAPTATAATTTSPPATSAVGPAPVAPIAPQPGGGSLLGPTPAPGPDASTAPGQPSAAPTIAIPPALPGPGSLVPPLPRQTGADAPSPFPIPTFTPVPVSTGPVILTNPTGQPSIEPAGPSGAPFYAPTPRPPAGATQAPAPVQPRPLGTLAPNSLAILADRGDGNTNQHQPGDFDGNVHVFYAQGQIVGDHAHYDGDHTISITGHAYLINRDQNAVLYADLIEFDTVARRAILFRGSGETTEGVEVGKLHYIAQRIQTRNTGVTHADRATFTTCDKPHSGYHVNARAIDVMPGDKLVAHNATIFLGALAIFYIPLLIIPLREIKDPRRPTTFLPVFGYSKTEGAFVMARLAFDEGPTYYGYYRIDYYTKRGLGLGYDAYIGTRNNRRQATIDAYTISDHISNTRQTNITASETENFSNTLRSQLGVNYTGDFGAGISLPASLNITGSLIHSGRISTENLTFSRFVQGKLSDNYNLGLIDSLNLSPQLTQQFNFSYSKFNSQIASSDTFHINTLTHYFTRLADLNLKYDKTDFSAEPFGYDSVPELQIMPHIPFGSFRFPFQTELTVGQYTEPQNHFSTQRVQGVLNYPVFLQLGTSSFNAGVNITQDYYGTGDAKGYITQNAALSTPYGNHIVNSITYNEQNPLGPANVPFQLLDRLSGGSHSAQDVLRIYNGNVYSIQLSSGTQFNRMAQSVNYQISLRPSPRSLLLLGGYYQPGPGNGFNTTNVQGVAPLGPYTDIEYTTNVDYKNKFRLEDKNLYLTKIIDCCYRLQASYNQDLKQFNLSANLLAFPSRSIGVNNQSTGGSSIIPQSFAF